MIEQKAGKQQYDTSLEVLENWILFPCTTEVIVIPFTLRCFKLDIYSDKINLLSTADVQRLLVTTWFHVSSELYESFNISLKLFSKW